MQLHWTIAECLLLRPLPRPPLLTALLLPLPLRACTPAQNTYHKAKCQLLHFQKHVQEAVVPARSEALLQTKHLNEAWLHTEDLCRRATTETQHQQRSKTLHSTAQHAQRSAADQAASQKRMPSASFGCALTHPSTTSAWLGLQAKSCDIWQSMHSSHTQQRSAAQRADVKAHTIMVGAMQRSKECLPCHVSHGALRHDDAAAAVNTSHLC